MAEGGVMILFVALYRHACDFLLLFEGDSLLKCAYTIYSV
jgi:hypothetical protein